MRDHRKLKAFQLADKLVVDVYDATRHFPREELFGLTSQMRRAAVSVAGNIVEGCARSGHNEYLNFLNMGFASLRELGYYIGLSKRLNLVGDETHRVLSGQHDEASRVLAGLIKSLRSGEHA